MVVCMTMSNTKAFTAPLARRTIYEETSTPFEWTHVALLFVFLELPQHLWPFADGSDVFLHDSVRVLTDADPDCLSAQRTCRDLHAVTS